MANRYFILFSFDGGSYNGWQVQSNTTKTVQEVINNSLSIVLQEKILTVGAGRTDKGVHSSYFVAHFDLEQEIKNKEIIIYRLNSILPNDIAVFDILKVDSTMHARFSAIKRTYKYYITSKKDVFNYNYRHYFRRHLDIEKMNYAAKTLLEYDDFTSFAKLGGDSKTNICNIFEAYWEEQDELKIFTITADRFLRGMVRALVGTILLVGENKINLDDFRKIIEAKNRASAGANMPAKALFLCKIEYPEN